MLCPSCSHENPQDAGFCGQCGASLAKPLTCPSCGRESPPAQKFCNGCGQRLVDTAKHAATPKPRSYTPKHLAEKILSSRSALEGERKQVTVLFCDVKGSMELASAVDAEEWHGILDRFFRILADGVHRFEGTINQYTGDGVMALFGAPIAHEDHAARACYAALHLKEELRRYGEELKRKRGLAFLVRVGIHSGEVVVGKIGDDLRMDYTAQGETVGLAARMQELADPGAVYLTHRTAGLVTGLFALRDLGPFDVKGVAQPVRVHELQGAGRLRTRLDVSRSRGFSKFVGREAETRVLETALERAIEGQGQVVGVVGEPGVGKSRLCLEFVENCRSRGIFVNEAHCPPHGRTIPYLPILELWRSYFGVLEHEPPEESRRKIAGTLLLLDDAFRESLPILFEFLGVGDPEHAVPPMDPEARQRSLFAFLRNLTRSLAARQPLVILIDDVHWIDPASDAFVGQFVEVIKGRRVLFLANFRPEYQGAWLNRSHYQQIPLLPLGAEAAEALLDDLLGTHESLGRLRDRIRERTGGNPFFIEEVVQSLAETGALAGARGAHRLERAVESLHIPGTVQVVLAARIDQLAEREKRLLQVASVVGKTVPGEVLERIAGLDNADLASSVGKLAEAEFLFEAAIYPSVEYAFKHPLTQEVAYQSQLAERRQHLHSAVARAIADVYADKIGERAAEVAHHFESAAEAFEAARWHRRAAEWAGFNAPVEMVRHWRKVVELTATETESMAVVELGLTARAQLLLAGWRLGFPEGEARKIYLDGRAVAERTGQTRPLAMLLLGYATVVGVTGEIREYVDRAAEAARLALEDDDLGIYAAALTQVQYSLYCAGDHGKLEAINDAAFTDPRVRPDAEEGLIFASPYRVLLFWKAYIAAYRGHLARATAELDEVLRLCTEAKDLDIAICGHAIFAEHAYNLGDAPKAREHANRCVELSDAAGGAYLQNWAHVALGMALIASREWTGAREHLQRSIAISREARTGIEREALKLALLAEAELGAGDLDCSRRTADDAIAVANRQGARFFEALGRLALGRVLLARGGSSSLEEAEHALRRALAFIAESGAKTYEPFVRVELAKLARANGDHDARERELREAHRLFTEIGAPIRAAEVARELDT